MANSFLDKVSQVITPEEDNSNSMIGLPYLGNTNPKKTLESPDASFEEKALASDSLVQMEAKRLEQEQASEAKQMADEAKRFNAWQNANKKYDEMEQMSKSSGGKIKLPSRDEALAPEKFGLDTGKIAKYSNPEVQQAAAPIVAQVEQQTQEQNDQSAIEQANVLGQKQAERENSMMNGYMARQKRIDDRQVDLMDQSIKAVDDEQYKLDQIDPQRFWNNLSGGQKVLGSLAIALGEVGRSLTKSGTNSALDIVNKAIDRDIDSQKLNNEQKIALKQNALKRIALEVDKFSALSKNNERQFEMQKYAETFRQQAEGLRQQAAQNAMLKNQLFGEGISPDQVDLLSDSQKKRTMVLPNGKITLAAIDGTALEDAKKKIGLADTVLTQIKDFKQDAMGMSVGDKLNPWSTKGGRVSSKLNALIGNLREPITGPGILTPQEYERLEEGLGDVKSVLTTPELMEARISGIEKLVQLSKKAQYKNAGVNIPDSKPDMMRIKLYKMGKTPEQVETALKALSKSDPTYRD